MRNGADITIVKIQNPFKEIRLLLIYSPKVTNRLQYTLDFIFKQYFGIEYELTDRIEATPNPDITRISYSFEKPAGYYSIFQNGLLSASDIKVQQLFVSRESDIPIFFQTTEHYDLKFDLFSCVFYLLSRYEEYLPHKKDEHGRYLPSNSILSKKEFNFTPIIETWLIYFKERLLKINPALLFKEYKFEYQPTLDIDNAFKYSGRNWFKHPPNFFKQQGIRVLFNKEKDPYDTLDFITDEANGLLLKPIFFFLLSDKTEKDSTVSPRSAHLKLIIQNLSTENKTIGIHPSYSSFEEKSIQKERALLEELSGSAITISRQHFLKIHFPHYFRGLIDAGIRIDYSLGYPDIPGFRAGFSREFPFFDLEKNETTSLILQPFSWMDATFEYYQTTNYIENQQKIILLITQLKKIKAKLVTIFHNDLIAKGDYRNTFKFINQQI